MKKWHKMSIYAVIGIVACICWAYVGSQMPTQELKFIIPFIGSMITSAFTVYKVTMVHLKG